MKKIVSLSVRYSFFSFLIFSHIPSFASAFMLFQEQNAVETGTYGSGVAALAEDASTSWYNPAGLVRLDKPQVVIAGNEIILNTSYTGTVSQSESILHTSAVQSVSNVQGGTSNLLPVFYASYPLSPKIVAAFSVNTPFGLATSYDADTFVRYASTSTQLKAIDLSPSLGFKIDSAWSLGVGFDEERLLASFDSYAGLPGLAGVPDNAYDTVSHSKVSDWAPGWHAGVLYQPSTTTRIGLAYHSQINHHSSGYSSFEGPLVDGTIIDHNLFPSDYATTTLYLPANAELTAYHDMNNRWAVEGTVSFTQWDVFQQVLLKNILGLDQNGVEKQITVGLPQNYHNTWRASVGTMYQLNDQWMVRAGAGYDQSPVNNADRDLRIPDANHIGLAVGGRYHPTKNLTLDGGYTHEFVLNAGMNNRTVAGPQTVTLQGTSSTNANILALQATYSFS